MRTLSDKPYSNADLDTKTQLEVAKVTSQETQAQESASKQALDVTQNPSSDNLAAGQEAARQENAQENVHEKVLEKIIYGVGISPGIAVGHVTLRQFDPVKVVDYPITLEETPEEIQRLNQAVEKSLRQLRKLKSKAAGLHGMSSEELGYLLDAHMQMLSSARLIEAVRARICNRLVKADIAVRDEIDAIASTFDGVDDPYLRTRGNEIREVGARLLRNLSSVSYESFRAETPGSIIVASEITPADTAIMDPMQVYGFVSVIGGRDGHTAIMARALGLPAVVGLDQAVMQYPDGTPLVLDGKEGIVILNPSQKTLLEFKRRQKDLEKSIADLLHLREMPAATQDGHSIDLKVNLDLPREASQAVQCGSDGVGLLRTEYLFMNRNDIPSEDEQYQHMSDIIRQFAGKPVTIRTIDAGGEKLVNTLTDANDPQASSELGVRAIRLSLRLPDLLETQFKAILRANIWGPVRILLPLVTTPDEVYKAREILNRADKALRRRGEMIADELPPLGIMIETPAAAMSLDSFAEVADFFALGTNDLLMYTLAIDRREDGVAHLYNPTHPGFLRLVAKAAEQALAAGKPISVCGELAADPRFTGFLLGVGVGELSMGTTSLPRLKKRIRSMHLDAAKSHAGKLIRATSMEAVAMHLDEFNLKL